MTGALRTLWLCVLTIAVTSAHAHEVGKLRNPRMPVPPRGEAQCVVATADDLPGGAKAEGKPGDYVLRNHLATFVVAAPRMVGGYSRYGGRVVDAVLNEPGHDEDLLGETFLATVVDNVLFNMRVLRGERAEIVSHGGAGKNAHLRVVAVDDRFPIVDTTLRFPSSPQQLRITIDYILPPDSRTLLVNLTVQNDADRQRNLLLFWGQILGDGLVTLVPPWGTSAYALQAGRAQSLMGLVSSLQANMPLVAAVGARVSYAFFNRREPFPQMLHTSHIYLYAANRALRLTAKGSAELALAFSVGEGEMETLWREVRRLRDETMAVRTLSGRVTDSAGRGVESARVYLLREASGGGEFVSVVQTDERGQWRARVPEEGTYRAIVFADGYSPASAAVHNDALIRLEGPALLRFRLTDERRAVIPGALVFERLSSAMPKQERARFGEEGDFGRFDRVHYSLKGQEVLRVEPGRYRITATRGFEYEVDQREVELSAAQEVAFNATLRRVVRVPGYLSGDFHVHALPSPDSADPLADKVTAYVATGVQILTATDHDVLTDYSPVINALGAQRWITSVVGCEISPNFGLGHFNAYPQRFDISLPNNGAIEWYDLEAEQIFAAARRNNDGDTIVQVNHPRGGGAAYFSWVGLNPQEGVIERPERFSPNFDAIEVFNGTDVNQLDQTLPDWFYFLNRGNRYIAIGNTDSHNAYRLEPGFPRTYLFFGHGQVQRVNPQQVVRAIRSGNVLVCGGPVVNMRVQGQPVGATVSTRDGLVQLEVSVQSASWVRVNRLTLYVNGAVAQELPIEHPEGKALHWSRRLTLKVERDSWVVARVDGEGFTALYPDNRPASFTNPVYIDMGGDGWKPAP